MNDILKFQIEQTAKESDIPSEIVDDQRKMKDIKISNCRVPFGVISSPFLLGATIDCLLRACEQPIAEKNKDRHVCR